MRDGAEGRCRWNSAEFGDPDYSLVMSISEGTETRRLVGINTPRATAGAKAGTES